MSQPAQLKEWFNAARYRQIAADLADVYPAADPKVFLARTLPGLDELSLLQRLRRTTEALHAVLPADFPAAVAILRRLAPKFRHNFVSLVLPDYVGLHGHGHFAESMASLKFFTPFGSSEFAIREFLRRDLSRTLAVMAEWSADPDEHVRRLASEGCRPRLPWSFRLEALVADPGPVTPILENLRADPSLYVRKSVANHLNDITKDHPHWVLDRLTAWNITESPHRHWIAKHACRTLIKRGHPQALELFGFGQKPALTATLTVTPKSLHLGQHLTLSTTLTSTSRKAQTLAIDYIVHYVRANENTSEKVFKWTEVTLPPGATLDLTKKQTFRDFTTRRHYPGHHRIELQINGHRLAETAFTLQ